MLDRPRRPWRLPWQFASVLGAITLLCGWQVLGLPGHLVRRHNPPPDQPWFPYGLRTAYLSADDELVLKRKGYLDRIGTYSFSGNGRLRRLKDDDVVRLEQDDVAGIFRGNRKRTRSNMAIDVNTSSQYFQWIAAVKDNAGDPHRLAEVLAGDGSEFVSGPLSRPEPYVEVNLYPDDRLVFELLEGHQYYPIFDSVAFREPHLWLTTDRATWLHQIWIREEPEIAVSVLNSAPIAGGSPQAHNTILGFEPQRNELFLLDSRGERRWFDPDSLELLQVEQLPGEWRFEYGALATHGEDFSFHYGLPLSEAGYARTMRVLMVVFLAGLLWLMLIWSRRWMSILERTTADTPPRPS